MVSSSAKCVRAARHLLPAVAVIASSACFSAAPGAVPATSDGEPALGTFELSGPGLATGTIAPGRCAAGDREQFLGADLSDVSSGLVVRLVIDPLEGPALRVHSLTAPWDRGGVLFFHDECERFEMSFEPTGWIVNDVVVRDLVLAVDCANQEGATLRGRATARCD